MKQIKIFKVSYPTDSNNYQKVEDLVNDWLKENPNATIINISYQENITVANYGYGNGVETDFYPAVLVVYETNS